MAATVVQSSFNGLSATTSQSIPFPAAISNGNTMLLIVNLKGTTASGLPSGTATDYQDTTTFGDNISIYRLSNITDGRNNFAFTTSASIDIFYVFLEVAGLSNSSPLDAVGGTQNSSNPVASVSLTSSTANQFMLAMLTEQGGSTNTVLAGPPTQSIIHAEAGFTEIVYALDAGAAGAKTIGATMTNGSTPNKCFGVSYKIAAAGSAPKRQMLLGVG